MRLSPPLGLTEHSFSLSHWSFDDCVFTVSHTDLTFETGEHEKKFIKIKCFKLHVVISVTRRWHMHLETHQLEVVQAHISLIF